MQMRQKGIQSDTHFLPTNTCCGFLKTHVFDDFQLEKSVIY